MISHRAKVLKYSQQSPHPFAPYTYVFFRRYHESITPRLMSELDRTDDSSTRYRVEPHPLGSSAITDTGHQGIEPVIPAIPLDLNTLPPPPATSPVQSRYARCMRCWRSHDNLGQDARHMVDMVWFIEERFRQPGCAEVCGPRRFKAVSDGEAYHGGYFNPRLCQS